MNIVILLNSLNLEDIKLFIAGAVESQEKKEGGALVVVYQQRIGKEFVEELVKPLFEKMSAGATIPANINTQESNDGRNSSLFAFFISQGYAQFPGPWLVIDGPGVPKGKNFLTEIEKQHRILGGTCSGRLSTEGVANVPIGPVVLGLPVTSFTWFTQGGRESWRVTMRFMFARCGFKLIPISDYPFTLPSIYHTNEAPPAAPAPPENPPSPPIFDNSALDQQPAVSPQAAVADTGCPGTDTVCPDDAEPPFEPGADRDPGKYEGLDREALFTLIAARPHLDKPHHSTGLPKLLAILLSDDETESATQS